MPTNRNAILRYNTLDRCFSNHGRKYYFDDLLEVVNEALLEFDPDLTPIKTRQLRDDIRFMRSDAGYSAPITAFREGKKAYYRYEDKNFSINNSPLNSSEAQQLKTALSILKRFEGTPHFEWISEMNPMLSNRFGLESEDKTVISYNSNIDYSGYELIQPVFNAIVNRRVLKVVYKPFNKDSFELSFHPYFLKEYNNRWFAFGLNEELKIPKWNVALDRIVELNECENTYVYIETDWEDFFYDIIGVTKPDNGTMERITLVFSPDQANYIITKPLHPSQKHYKLDNGHLKVVLNLIPNYELEMLLLSFGDKVEVVEPVHLKDKIKSIHSEAINNYH